MVGGDQPARCSYLHNYPPNLDSFVKKRKTRPSATLTNAKGAEFGLGFRWLRINQRAVPTRLDPSLELPWKRVRHSRATFHPSLPCERRKELSIGTSWRHWRLSGYLSGEEEEAREKKQNQEEEGRWKVEERKETRASGTEEYDANTTRVERLTKDGEEGRRNDDNVGGSYNSRAAENT